jgi:hypothetical protein
MIGRKHANSEAGSGSAGTTSSSRALGKQTLVEQVYPVQMLPAAGASGASRGGGDYASGDRVAFREEPDLHTAAHIMQQASGVRLKDGIGEVGDTYERHADAVADRVVRGESAADLLTPGGI